MTAVWSLTAEAAGVGGPGQDLSSAGADLNPGEVRIIAVQSLPSASGRVQGPYENGPTAYQ